MDTERLHDFYRGKTVLVTGHTGFKGSWLTLTLLQMGAKVIGVSLPPKTKKDIFVLTGLETQVSHHEFDIRNFERLTALISAEKPDVVFHLAAQPLVRQSYDDPLNTMTTNVVGTANVLEALRLTRSVKAAVIITTDKVYENREQIYGYRETDPLGGHDPYSGSKAAADIVTNSYRKSFFSPEKYNDTHNTLIATARAGNVIGGGDWSQDRLVPEIMRAVFDGNGVVTLRNPQSTRPWEHVLESVSGYLTLGMRLGNGERGISGNWNFGPMATSFVSVGELAERTLKILGQGFVRVQEDTSKHEANELTLDVTKAHRVLGWKSRWDVDETVLKTAEWYRETNADPSSALAVTNKQIEQYFNFQKKSL
jgi:CDP-glucose 4,6-dehydratase